MPYLIPETVEPENSICVMVHVPNDENHIRAFWGALDTLGKHWNWDAEEPNTTGPVSLVWQQVIRTAHANMGDCLVHTHLLRQTECTIELLINGQLETSFKLDAEKCGLLNVGGDGTKITPPDPEEEDKKTALFSGAMALVIYCQEAVLDAFNAIEAEIEIGKAATVWMETVPGLDLSPAHEVLMACDDFNEMLESVFEATDTPEWREEMSCKIMCWCVANDYAFDSSIVDRWREYLTEQGLSPPDYFYSNFVDVATYKALIDRFSLGMNDENEDWLVLCDVCEKLAGQITFDDVENDLEYEIQLGTLGISGNPDNCMRSETTDPPHYDTGEMIQILVTLPEVSTVVRVTWDCFLTDTDPLMNCGHNVIFYDAEMEDLGQWQRQEEAARNAWYLSDQNGVKNGVKFIRVRYGLVAELPSNWKMRLDNVKVFKPED